MYIVHVYDYTDNCICGQSTVVNTNNIQYIQTIIEVKNLIHHILNRIVQLQVIV